MTGPADATADPGVGARLRAARERAGLSSLQASAKLHLEPRVIEALEAGEFAVLGAPVYVRGHLRRYAELINAPAGELLAAYAAEAALDAPPDPAQLKANVPVRPPRQLAGPVVGVIVAATVLAGIWLALKGLPNASQPGAVPPPASSTPATGQPLAATTPVAHPPAPVTTSTATAATAEAPAAAPAADAVSPSGAAARASTQALHLRLTINADSWLEVHDATGKRLYYDLARAPGSVSLTGVPPLRVLLGFAEGVGIEADGRRLALPADARRGRSARFEVSAGGVVSPST